MTVNEVVEKIKADKNHTQQDIEVARLLHNFGLTYICSGKQIKNKGGDIIGEVDLAFYDESEKILFIIEVSKQNSKTTQKVDHFFSRWSDEDNLDVFCSKYSLTPYKILKLNFDLFKRVEQDDFTKKASLKHAINESNILINENDFKYFSQSFKIIDVWAKNDFYNFLNLHSESGYTDVEAISYYTGGERAFVFADKVSNILRYSYIYRKRENESGYQRMIEQGRIGSILKVINKKKTITFPNSIILNSDSILTSEKIKKKDPPKLVKIKIPKGYCSFRVIDGQHRLMGFAKMGSFNRDDYSLPIVILEKLDKSKEIETFIEINHKQKRLDSNLILSLKAEFNWKVEDKEFFEKISVLIAKELNKKSEIKNNIFFGYSDEKKGQKITVTTLHSAIKKNNLIGEKMHIFQTTNTDFQEPYNKIKSVLSNIAKIFPQEKSFFFTNLGVRILFRYVQIFERNVIKKNITSSFEENLKHLKDAFPKNTMIEIIKKQYGEGGATVAAELLCKKLKKHNKEYRKYQFDLRKL